MPKSSGVRNGVQKNQMIADLKLENRNHQALLGFNLQMAE